MMGLSCSCFMISHDICLYNKRLVNVKPRTYKIFKLTFLTHL